MTDATPPRDERRLTPPPVVTFDAEVTLAAAVDFFARLGVPPSEVTVSPDATLTAVPRITLPTDD